MLITHPKNNINENQKHHHILLIMKNLLQFFFEKFVFIRVPIGILILGLEKVKSRFEDLNGVGIQFFSKPINDRHIVNDMKLPPVP